MDDDRIAVEEQPDLIALAKHLVSLLRTSIEPCSNDHRACLQRLSIAVFSTYSRQVQLRQQTPIRTRSRIHRFEGCEGDVVAFSPMCCNSWGEIEFVKGERRLKGAWTNRARYRRRSEDARGRALGKRALAARTEVVIVRLESA